ncbi:hypothetical protein [Flavobacterium reichenbachii]|jgi:hypothetical protein|uniref:Uncharacterized protein n=1 Tax=Flavobacterium reichenbachii TaxID=362418 RepID=A0A085ZIV2_9FLAO|nr:hypothetical protein [Flavobacterium reichenbachii]KFF04366.1 hypothetical protein IW19_01965 [Flavobacterium reichenbachii]OXB11643.1 hypothetical protein B0A68_20595 [Flavobacterium reichenbachii]
MKSKLSITEFRARLNNNIEIGSVKVKLSTFRLFPRFGGSKPFYGHFDDTDFRLTLNSELSPTIFVVKGKYKSVDNLLKLDYIVEPNSKFQSIWVEYFPIVLIVAINLFFLFFGKGLRRASTIVNLFLLFMAFYSRWKENRKKKKLEQKFLRIFEIIE